MRFNEFKKIRIMNENNLKKYVDNFWATHCDGKGFLD